MRIKVVPARESQQRSMRYRTKMLTEAKEEGSLTEVLSFAAKSMANVQGYLLSTKFTKALE